MYSDAVLDHFHYPRNVGEIEDASIVVEASNPVCGDVLKLWATIRDGKIEAVKFKAAGCVPSVACGSWLSDAIMTKPWSVLQLLTPEAIANALGGLPPASNHASALAADALSRLLATIGG